MKNYQIPREAWLKSPWNRRSCYVFNTKKEWKESREIGWRINYSQSKSVTKTGNPRNLNQPHGNIENDREKRRQTKKWDWEE